MSSRLYGEDILYFTFASLASPAHTRAIADSLASLKDYYYFGPSAC
ncbi:hypothetical protein [Niastella sp. OAS944]|nr:hypothetical protein [Chitinophagaceae bacterium OAS944]